MKWAIRDLLNPVVTRSMLYGTNPFDVEYLLKKVDALAGPAELLLDQPTLLLVNRALALEGQDLRRRLDRLVDPGRRRPGIDFPDLGVDGPERRYRHARDVRSAGANPLHLDETRDEALVRGDQPDPAVQVGADRAFAPGRLLRLRDDAGDLSLQLLLLQLQHRQKALKPLQRLLLGLELRFSQFELRHRFRLYHFFRIQTPMPFSIRAASIVFPG